jgi:replicative DNA helicase
MSVESRVPRPGSQSEVSLPWDDHAERAVIGAAMLDPRALDAALELIGAQDFHKPAHRVIFEALVALAGHGEVYDTLTVRAELERTGFLDRAGGGAYVNSLVDGLPRTTNVAAYARIVHDRSLLRQMLRVSEDLKDNAAGASRPALEILDEAEKRLFDLSEKGRRGGFRAMSEIAEEGIATLEDLSERRELITGLATGYERLDQLTAGLQKGDLIILAGRPGMGKTALALNIAQNAAIASGATVGAFSLEMSSQQLFLRLLAGEARVRLRDLRTGALSDDDWRKVTAAHERLARARIFVDDSASIGPMEVRSKARRLKYEHGLSLLVIDYLQMMKLETRAENRQQEVSEISRSLKAIAKELQTPVLAVSQLSRQPEMARSGDRRPQLSDLRDSGAIEQDADIVMFIYRPEVYEKDPQKASAQDLEGKAELIIAKQRNGPTDTVHLFYVKDCTRFETQADSSRY